MDTLRLSAWCPLERASTSLCLCESRDHKEMTASARRMEVQSCSTATTLQQSAASPRWSYPQVSLRLLQLSAHVMLTPEGQIIRVNGTNFGTTLANVTVRVEIGSGGTAVLNCDTTGLPFTHSSLRCLLPEGVGTSRAVTVTVNLQSSFPSGIAAACNCPTLLLTRLQSQSFLTRPQ